MYVGDVGQEYVPINQSMQEWSLVTYDEYENRIMFLMREDHTKTYTAEQIRGEIVGDSFTWQKGGYDMPYVARWYNEVDEALDRLVEKGKVNKKEGGSSKVVYGLKTSYARRVCLLVDRLGSWWVRRRGRLDRRVKRIHRNWLALFGIMTSIVIILLRFLWPLDIWYPSCAYTITNQPLYWMMWLEHPIFHVGSNSSFHRSIRETPNVR